MVDSEMQGTVHPPHLYWRTEENRFRWRHLEHQGLRFRLKDSAPAVKIGHAAADFDGYNLA